MRAWIFFHRPVDPEEPEAIEVLRFKETAERLGIELEVLKPQDFDLVVATKRGWFAAYDDGRRLERPDLILPRTGSETSYFMLAVMRHFERQGIAMANGSLAVERVADKLHTLQVLSAEGVPIPRTILGKFPVDVDLVERELGFPVVVKTLRGTRGTGVVLCESRANFNDLASLLGDARADTDFIFQRYIRASHGRDVRVLVVDGRAVAAMERRSADGGFKSNISLGGHGERFEPPAEMAALAVRVAHVLDLDIAGVDILFDEDGYRVCEANSSPGFQGLEAACDIDVPEAVFTAMANRLRLRLGGPPSWRDRVRGVSRSFAKALDALSG